MSRADKIMDASNVPYKLADMYDLAKELEADNKELEAALEAAAKSVDHILKDGGGTYGDAIRARGLK